MNEFAEAQQRLRNPGVAGWWEKVLPELPDEKRDSLMDAARSDQISHRAISTVLGKWGFGVTPAQVGHWRRTHVR